MAAEVIEVVWKTGIFYFLLLIILRVTGKREIGNFNAIDLVAFVMVSEAAIISIADNKIPLLIGATPVIVIGLLEWGLSYLSLKSRPLRAVVEGEPSVLISHGKINEGALRRLRFNLGDLMSELRHRRIFNLGDVEFAVLEPSGKLSVLPRQGARAVTADDLRALGLHQNDPSQTLPTPDLQAALILDGAVNLEALQRSGKDRDWLEAEIRRQGITGGPESVLVAALDNTGSLLVQPRQAADQGRDAGDKQP